MVAVDETDTLPKPLVAWKDLDPVRSGLTCEVVVGQANEVELQLVVGKEAVP